MLLALDDSDVASSVTLPLSVAMSLTIVGVLHFHAETTATPSMSAETTATPSMTDESLATSQE